MHLLGYCSAITHFLYEVQQLRYYSGNTATACEQYNSVKGCEVPLHAAVGAINESAVGLVGPFIESGGEDFAGEAAEGAEDKGHVSVLLAVVGGEVVAAEGGDGEGVVFEDRNAGHAEVDVLAWGPFDLGRYCDLDGVFREDCHCGLFTY